MARIVHYIHRLLALSLLLMVVTATGRAGQLSEDLVRQVSSKKSTDLVKVWIKLPDVEDAATLKTVAASSAKTRTGRYRITRERLYASHTAAQRDLLGHLRSIRSVPQQVPTESPKGHWLVNIIEAEVTVEQLYELSQRDDVETILAVPEITTIAPEGSEPATAISAGVEANLSYINAPTAWAAGYTGEGRIVCIFDTGVDGLHPALYDNWKGHDGNPAAAWFDPAAGESFPHVLPVQPGAVTYHGTATTGLAVGHDDATGDTVGVALDAKWIAAAVADIEGASIIDAFEWAANPDGDPNNIDDVPDVINHSWGIQNIGCQDVFYTMIDNTEALGIVNIFAAGNEGTNFPAIRNPANRAIDSLDCFAIGNINHTTSVLSPTSSRGPSDCNGAIKPNVVAPGVLIRIPVPVNTYSTASGTSFAAPHVSGLVALLREKNPNATPDEIKKAILTSTNHLNKTLPNNDYGWGLVDCMAAIRALSGTNTEPNVRVFAFDHDPISPGDTVEGSLVLKNLGGDVRNITVLATNSNPSLKVLNGLAIFGDIDEGDTVRAAQDLRVVVSDTVAIGSVLTLDLQISNATGYSKTLKLYFLVEQRDKRSLLTHNVGNIEFTLTNFGTFGVGEDSYFDAGGAGFKFRLGSNDLWDGGLMIGRDASHVSDGVTNVAFEPDGDFSVVSSGSIDFVTPIGPASEQTYSRFTDERAENPLGVELTQVSYAFDDAPYQDIVILRYVVRNTGAS
ncbi:MAG: S8 family serine peptidase [Candidatus Zixiibacteriota bacterium]|nr:MAG: S8 family serine peptidase [candidate division Zixibacteria bacterium]